MKKILHILPLFVSLLELGLYAFHETSVAYLGIAKASPKFRDLYVLTLNALCNIPPHKFSANGSCSDFFYGVPAGSFDYPLPIFHIAQSMPEYFFRSPQLLAFTIGSSLILSVYAIVNTVKSSLAKFILLILIYGSHPFRYLLERGQLDSLAWTIALSPLWIIPLLRKTQFPNDTEYSNELTVSSSLFLSAIIKGFTFPALLIWSAVKIKGIGLKTFILRLVYFILGLKVLVLAKSKPGSFSSIAQIMPGEIFGISVGLGNSDYITPYAGALLKVTFILLGVIYGLIRLRYNLFDKHQPVWSFLKAYSVFVGSCTFLSFYILTVSASYKLFPLVIILIALQIKDNKFIASNRMEAMHYSTNNGNKPTSQFKEDYSLRLFLSVLILTLIYEGYMPYTAEIQFLKVDFINFILQPLMAGITLSLIAVAGTNLFHSKTIS